jgi:hypothetical protein
MAKLIGLQLDDETKIYLETSGVLTNDGDPLFEKVSSGEKIIDKTKGYWDKILTQVKTFSSSISESIRNISDEVEVEFSIKLAADAGIIISSVSTEASITVKLKWCNPQQ